MVLLWHTLLETLFSVVEKTSTSALKNPETNILIGRSCNVTSRTFLALQNVMNSIQWKTRLRWVLYKSVKNIPWCLCNSLSKCSPHGSWRIKNVKVFQYRGQFWNISMCINTMSCQVWGYLALSRHWRFAVMSNDVKPLAYFTKVFHQVLLGFFSACCHQTLQRLLIFRSSQESRCLPSHD